VFPDLIFDERKFYFTLHHVKLNNSKVKPVYENNCASPAYPAIY